MAVDEALQIGMHFVEKKLAFYGKVLSHHKVRGENRSSLLLEGS